MKLKLDVFRKGNSRLSNRTFLVYRCWGGTWTLRKEGKIGTYISKWYLHKYI